MTSEQVMLTVVGLALVASLGGCETDPRKVNVLDSPYDGRRVWAVAPLGNESGSRFADGLAMADKLARHLETASNIDTLAVNRTLAAMEVLKLSHVASPEDARELLALLQADGLVVGVVKTWEPYDPPRIGVALELYTSDAIDAHEHRTALDTRQMTGAATDHQTQPGDGHEDEQPVSVVSAYFDAADPRTRDWLKQYANRRGPIGQFRDEDWHRYRVSMDLYSDFVSYVMSWRLLEAERHRLTRLVTGPASP